MFPNYSPQYATALPLGSATPLPTNAISIAFPSSGFINAVKFTVIVFVSLPLMLAVGASNLK